jgi:putative ABC transport system ATP-binding protein
VKGAIISLATPGLARGAPYRVAQLPGLRRTAPWLPYAGPAALRTLASEDKLIMSDPIVQVRNVTKRFTRDGFEIVALDNVDLELYEGDFMALMGPSGSGKSTLLNLLAGIDRVTDGEVDVMGTNLTRMTESQLAVWRNAHIGYIFQTFNLVPVLTAFENVELPLLLTKLSKAERRKNVETALDLVGLSDRMNHQPRQLSGGQEQRVAIARAIVTDPDLILADEPTGNLDARSGEEIMQILSTLNRELNKTIMLVTHDPHAASFAKDQRHLEKGVLTQVDDLVSHG